MIFLVIFCYICSDIYISVPKVKETITIAKPFVKWAGGKGKLKNTLESQLPADFNQQVNVTYIEPFVGGGAMLFHMLNNYPNIKRVVINDINKDLITCYKLIKNTPEILIEKLECIEREYHALENEEDRRNYYYAMRGAYNNLLDDDDERAACFMFLNHTCFNGLYRENFIGKFNVPFGRYKNPTICNEDVIMADHKVLAKVDVYCNNYSRTIRNLGKGYNFIYLDPPYRPLLGSSNFNQYSKSSFGDLEQYELKRYCDKLTKRGCYWMLSNSDSRNENGMSFFEELYDNYYFRRVSAPRVINATGNKRKRQMEVLITNY